MTLTLREAQFSVISQVNYFAPYLLNSFDFRILEDNLTFHINTLDELQSRPAHNDSSSDSGGDEPGEPVNNKSRTQFSHPHINGTKVIMIFHYIFSYLLIRNTMCRRW